MTDWQRIQGRIRKARASKDAPKELAALYESTRDAMVAFELARLYEKDGSYAEAAQWYTTAAGRFRRAQWKVKAQEALARLGVETPLAATEAEAQAGRSSDANGSDQVDPHSAAEVSSDDAVAAQGDDADDADDPETASQPGFESHAREDTLDAGGMVATDAGSGVAQVASDAAKKSRRRRGRRGGAKRRKKPLGKTAQVVEPTQASPEPVAAPVVRLGTDHRSSPPRNEGRIRSGRQSDSRSRVRSEAREPSGTESQHRSPEIPTLEAEGRIGPEAWHSRKRAGEPALASRLAKLESQLRRMLASVPHSLEESDHAPAGPGVFIVSDSDLLSDYYIEACQTLRIGIGNLLRSGRTQSGENIRGNLGEHLGINESRVAQYLKDHCAVRWLQLDEGSAMLAHFAIAVLRPPLNS
ncbi:MAG TPA: hypothetical protein VN862_09550 [Candidatus Acidoferrales bacterium]|nr:hypothetical protein [Candidatus Acidoferrales bacterium]